MRVHENASEYLKTREEFLKDDQLQAAQKRGCPSKSPTGGGGKHHSSLPSTIILYSRPFCLNSQRSLLGIIGRENTVVSIDSMMPFSFLAFIFCSLTILSPQWACEAFASHHKTQPWLSATLAAASNSDEKPDTNANAFALPSIGASSFWDGQREKDNSGDGGNPGYEGNALKSNGITIRDEATSPKFQLQYTCKICSTRNSHKVSRMAYRKGVVIVVCKGCESKHLIADNLGWSNYIGGFDFDNGERNIEQFMKNRNEESGGGEELVLRVDKKVFDLEKVLYDLQDGESAVNSSQNGVNLDYWN